VSGTGVIDQSSGVLETVYLLSGEVSADAIVSSLQALLPTRHHPMVRRRLVVLDTFDLRVRRAGGRLTRYGTNGHPTFSWQDRAGAVDVTSRAKDAVRFAWDLPDGPLKQALTPVIGVRRLITQAETDVSRTVLEFLDDRSKTVARMRIESGRARRPLPRSTWCALPCILTFTGLRGYEHVYDTLKPVLESRPGLTRSVEGFDDAILRAVGALPSHDREPGADLAPTVLAADGARSIHLALANALRANEPGLRAHLDSEFLHDFRVGVRRTRSLLGQIKDVFPPDALAHFSNEFSWLGGLTGPPRDLDVLVLSLSAPTDDVSVDDLTAVRTLLVDIQEREHKGLVDALDSDRYQRLLHDWTAFLERPAPFHSEAVNAGRPLADVVAERAWRLTRRIARRSESIDENTPADILHALRLDAKKLRYLIDVTPTFYDRADLERILSALKKLQRVLGDFNDAEVQAKRFADCGAALAAAQGSPSTVLALNRLEQQRHQQHDRLRKQVAEIFARFRADETRSACRRAFKRTVTAEPLA
jgi:CHAD domain-containing protein